MPPELAPVSNPPAKRKWWHSSCLEIFFWRCSVFGYWVYLAIWNYDISRDAFVVCGARVGRGSFADSKMWGVEVKWSRRSIYGTVELWLYHGAGQKAWRITGPIQRIS